MERRLAEWKVELDRVWSAHVPDYDEAIRLVQQIAGGSEEETLRQAASQALPILRSAAAHEDADHATREAARRRLGVIREVMSALTTPQFGKRSAAVRSLTPEERCRAVLGLPLDQWLSEAQIHRAYKLRAKRAHPDAGGNAEAFLKLSAAHDALMKERRMPQRH